jgi:hypothetical protein
MPALVHIDLALARPARELAAPFGRRQADQALALEWPEQRHQHRLALAVGFAVERHHAAEILQQRDGGGRQRVAPREAAGLVEHARRVFAANAQHALQHQARGEGVAAQRRITAWHELVAFGQQGQAVVETGCARQGAQRVGMGGRRGTGQTGSLHSLRLRRRAHSR